MKSHWFVAQIILLSSLLAPSLQASDAGQAATLSFGNVDYFHRWSKNGQNEYTPKGENDLNAWHDMITINVHGSVHNGEELAAMANQVLGNYQRAGKIIRTGSTPRTADRPAEHLVVAILGAKGVSEVAFARFHLVDGVGMVTVYSHREYGEKAADTISKWLPANGPSVEKTLMAWDKSPKTAALQSLPQAQ